jgi:hypothetical protein
MNLDNKYGCFHHEEKMFWVKIFPVSLQLSINIRYSGIFFVGWLAFGLVWLELVGVGSNYIVVVLRTLSQQVAPIVLRLVSFHSTRCLTIHYVH